MNKRGQFFLMAAFIIVGVLIGAKTVYNQANAPMEKTNIIDLSNEINFESIQVIDNKVFLGKKENLNSNIKRLSETYSSLNPTKDLVFIVGNETNYKIYSHIKKNKGSVGVSSSGNGGTIVPISGGNDNSENEDGQIEYQLEDYEDDENNRRKRVRVKLDNETSRTFNLKEGQRFYIIIKDKKDGEEIVASN